MHPRRGLGLVQITTVAERRGTPKSRLRIPNPGSQKTLISKISASDSKSRLHKKNAGIFIRVRISKISASDSKSRRPPKRVDFNPDADLRNLGFGFQISAPKKCGASKSRLSKKGFDPHFDLNPLVLNPVTCLPI